MLVKKRPLTFESQRLQDDHIFSNFYFLEKKDYSRVNYQE